MNILFAYKLGRGSVASICYVIYTSCSLYCSAPRDLHLDNGLCFPKADCVALQIAVALVQL